MDQAQADIEWLLCEARSWDWQDKHHDILARWRARRGDDGKTSWRWWWKLPEDDLYNTDHETKAAALAFAVREYPTAREIDVIEARCWSDDILAGDEADMFAESRNKERVTVPA